MKIALIAHDKKKNDIVLFAKEHFEYLNGHELFATSTTGTMIMQHTDLEITCLKSGPMGGDQEVGSMIANANLDLVIFFRDPLSSQPHEPDVSALIRLCDTYMIPTATNPKTAHLLMKALQL